jgi:Domain of unknown function (DUF5666)
MKKLITLLLIGLVASFAVLAVSPAGAKKGHPAKAAKAKRGLVHGTVKSVGSDSVTLTRRKGDLTVQVNADTKIVVNGQAGKLSDIQVGFRAVARVPRNGGPAKVLRAAAAPQPGTYVAGLVDSAGGNAITIKKRDGSTVTIPVNGDTKIRVNGNAGSLADIHTGYRAVVRRTAPDGPAAAINAYEKRANGQKLLLRGMVDSVGSDSITLRGRRGATVTVGVTGATIIRVNGAAGVLADVKAGFRALVLRDGRDGPALAIIALGS